MYNNNNEMLLYIYANVCVPVEYELHTTIVISLQKPICLINYALKYTEKNSCQSSRRWTDGHINVVGTMCVV